MIVLQILIVPAFVMILLSVVFIIGVAGRVTPRYENRIDQSLNKADEFYPSSQVLPPS